MPQTNITYDVPYNKGLVHLLHEMDEKHWQKAGTAYAPSMLGFKLSNFHNDYTDEPSAKMMIGGGSHADQYYLAPGNSPAYPPYMMSSGMLVHSGGALAGIDGAVGGYSFGRFLGDVADVGKHVAKEVGPGLAKEAIKSYMGTGRGRRVKKGGDIGSDILDGLKTVAPFAPLLMGLGEKKPKRASKKGGDIGSDILDGLKTVAPFAPLLMGLGEKKPKRASKKGGKMDLSKVIEVAEKAQPLADAVKKTISKSPMASAVLDKVAKVAKDVVSKSGSGGRSKRAEIVKKIMKEKGLKLIEASKYVKAHGLY